MGFGRSLAPGTLPVFSVADEEEAESLVVLACETDLGGNYIARELYESRIVRDDPPDAALEALYAFGDRLAKMHEHLIKAGRCRCERSNDATSQYRGGS